MFNALPTQPADYLPWRWEQIKPYFDDLQARDVNEASVVQWITDWARLFQIIGEIESRLYVATTLDTTDEAAENALNDFLENTKEKVNVADQRLKEKLLATGIEPPDFEIPLRDMRTEAAIFREANVPLFTEEAKLEQEYDRIIGAQTVNWNGEERTISQTIPELQNTDRAIRERAWRAIMDRKAQDRAALNDLWVQFLKLRLQIAKNADEPTFRDYMWKAMLRFDYTPDDCLRFHDAIEKAVVPAAQRLYDRKRQQLGVDTLRPWDADPQWPTVDALGRQPLRPFTSMDELSSVTANIFNQVDPELGAYYQTMMQEHLLDLDNRKGKAPGGYMTSYLASKRPFIFMNAVGLHDDVQTLLHEGGHAFHGFEAYKLSDYKLWQGGVPTEMAEVASMSMELLAAPYLAKSAGGFYSDDEAVRARVEHLENNIRFWPYMAVVDAFQHWVYTNPDAALNPDNCDAEWSRQWDRFIKGIDYSGLQAEKETGWQRKLHIFQIPFYYIEYGLAQLGATQVWGNSLKDQAGAIRAYRQALGLNGTKSLPELFKAAGATFAMDTDTVQKAVELTENEMMRLLEAETLDS